MSTRPEHPTPARRWTKPLLVAVPLVMVSGFVYTSCQFTEPDLPFIPKDAEVIRHYSTQNRTRYSYSSVNPLKEITTLTWKVVDLSDAKLYEKEILGKGFRHTYAFRSLEFRKYSHPKGEYIDLESGEDGYGSKWARLRFTHEVTRPGPRMVKDILLWMERLI